MSRIIDILSNQPTTYFPSTLQCRRHRRSPASNLPNVLLQVTKETYLLLWQQKSLVVAVQKWRPHSPRPMRGRKFQRCMSYSLGVRRRFPKFGPLRFRPSSLECDGR